MNIRLFALYVCTLPQAIEQLLMSVFRASTRSVEFVKGGVSDSGEQIHLSRHCSSVLEIATTNINNNCTPKYTHYTYNNQNQLRQLHHRCFVTGSEDVAHWCCDSHSPQCGPKAAPSGLCTLKWLNEVQSYLCSFST